MSIFIIYLKILNCQPLFSTNLIIIVITAPHTFWIFIHFDIFHQKHYHHTEHLSLKYFNFAFSLDFPHQIAYTITIVIISPVWERTMICCPPPTLHRSFSFATKSTFRPTPPILYIYLCTKYYAINTLTCTHFAPPTRFPPHIRRTLWEGKPVGIGRARKMVGAYPRARTHGKTRTNAPASRPRRP